MCFYRTILEKKMGNRIYEIKSQKELITILNENRNYHGFGWGNYRLRYNNLLNRVFYYIQWEDSQSWMKCIIVVSNNKVEGTFCLALQGYMEQEGAYKQAENYTFHTLIKPFLEKNTLILINLLK